MMRTSAVVREGSWLYDGTVPTRVRICRSPTWFGSGDHEDPPEEREDRDAECFYVEWEPAGSGTGGAGSGPFGTLLDAEEHVARASGNSVVWLEDSTK